MSRYLIRIGHAGATGGDARHDASLAELYQQLRSGALSMATGEDKWWCGLALVKASVEL